VHGRFERRAYFFGRAGCGDIRSFQLSSPVFGGSTHAPLTATFRVGHAGSASAVLLRGQRVVKRFAARDVAAGNTYRLRIAPSGLKPAAYKLRLTLSGQRGAATRTLVSRVI
jgi:hypothetical protein